MLGTWLPHAKSREHDLVEGVETRRQLLSLLKDLHIDRVRKFHMGMPVPAELLSAA